jgi:hypothetical protein
MKKQDKKILTWVIILLLGTSLSCLGGGGGCGTIPDDADWADICFWCVEESPTPFQEEISLAQQKTNTPQEPNPLAGIVTIEPSPITVYPNQPSFNLDMNAFCRSCANPQCQHVAVLLKDEVYSLVGQNDAGSWFLVQLEGSRCWVAAWTGSVEDSITNLDIVITPIVIFTPVVECSEFTTDADCTKHSDAGCYWTEAAGLAPYCAGP